MRAADDELYARGAATLVASWQADARGASDAAVQLVPGLAAAVFPHEPERSVYNNALLGRSLSARVRSHALDAMEEAYAAAGIERFAAWVHESDHALRHALELRGYRLHETTRAMGIVLDGARLPRPRLEVASAGWREHLRVAELPPSFLAGVDPAAYRVVIGRVQGESVATAIAFDFDGDCGVYNVSTLERARRRGLATAVTAALLHDALECGCTTASLQATPMAERLYAALGFRDLGRILEFVPPVSAERVDSPAEAPLSSGSAADRTTGAKQSTEETA